MKSRMMWAVALMFLGASLVAPVASRAADSGSWTAVAPPTAARAEAVAITLASGKVLVAGGSRSGPVTLTSAEIYDPATDTWAPAAPLGTARVGATGVRLHSGKVLVIGGSSSAGTPLDTAEVYDPTTNMWQNVTNAMGSPRAGGPMAQLLPDGRVLIAGGTDALDNPVATADLYDPTTNAFTPAHAMGSARAGAASALLPGGKVLVAGGASTGAGAPLSTAEVYDPAGNSWTPAANTMSAARGDAPGAGVLPGGRVLIMGGVSGSPTATSASSDIYDPATNTFSLGPAMHTSRALFATVTLAGGGILVAGGATLPPGAAAPP